jgi:hypothetical protein
MAFTEDIALQINNKYFDRFQNKDLNYLRRLYYSQIRLVDWNGEWNGIDTVLDENEAFFENEFTLTLQSTTDLYSNNFRRAFTNHITIEINGETLNVIDEIVVGSDHKIHLISATKQ